MNNKDIAPNESETSENIALTEGETTQPKASKRTRKRLAIAFFASAAVALIGAVSLIWFLSRDRQSGNPVPAPRSGGFEPSPDSNGQLPAAGQTLALQPDQLENAGIKIEVVGEQINTAETTDLASGVVRANAYRETPVISLVGGVIRQIKVQAGENISGGQTVAVVFSNEFAETQSRYIALLTELDNARRNYARTQKLVPINQTGSAEFEQAEKQLSSAEAALDEMKKRHQRTVKLVRIGAASREELEQDTTKLRTAEAEALEAQRRFKRSKQLLSINPQSRSENEQALNKVRTTESELGSVGQKLRLYGMSAQRVASLRTVSQITSEIAIPAPVSGTLTSRAVNSGEVIEANKELARITNLSSVWVIAQVFERNLVKLRTGSGASITSDAFPERIFRGTVTYIDPQLDEATRTAQVRIELDNPDNALKIGMYVRVAFGSLGDMERTTAVIPVSAVQTVNNRTIVFVATSQANIFDLRPVRLGPQVGAQYRVLEGLTVGERVVTEGSFMLRAEWLKTRQG